MVFRFLCQIARNAKFIIFRHGIRGYSRRLRPRTVLSKKSTRQRYGVQRNWTPALTFQNLSKRFSAKKHCTHENCGLFLGLPSALISSRYCHTPCEDYKYPFGKQAIPANVPLNPLKQKYVPKDPPKECPKEEEPTIRADDSCRTSTKPLPSLTRQLYTPCNEPLPESPPLERLKPRELHEVRHVCNPLPPIECPPRADDNLKLHKQKLPKLETSFLPKIHACNYVAEPLKRLPKVDIPEPPKLCTESTMQCHTPRADYNIRVGKRRLPMIKFDFVPETKAVPPPCPKLKRLPNLESCDQPKKPAVAPPEPCPTRCDDVSKTDPPKPLATLILKENNNFVSTREYNKKKEPPTFNFTIKRKFSLMAIITSPWTVSFLTVNALALNYYSKMNDEKLALVEDCETFIHEKVQDGDSQPSICQTTRSKSLPYLVLNKEMHTLAPNQRFSTVHRKFASSNSQKLDKKCNKRCVKIKIPGIAARQRETCQKEYVEKPGKKTKCPYPSFSESVKDLEYSVCECPELPKLLQPKNEMIPNSKLLEPVSPEWSPIDVDVEAKCVKEKLQIEPGETRTCENFHCPPTRIDVNYSKSQTTEKCVPKKFEERRKIATEPCPKPKPSNPWKKCYASWAATERARCMSTQSTVENTASFWQSLCGLFKTSEGKPEDALTRSKVPPPSFKCRKCGKYDDKPKSRKVAKKVQKTKAASATTSKELEEMLKMGIENPYTNIDCESLISLPIASRAELALEKATSAPLHTVALQRAPFPSFSESNPEFKKITLTEREVAKRHAKLAKQHLLSTGHFNICKCAKCERSFSTLRGALEQFSDGNRIRYEDLPLDLFSPSVGADEEEEVRVTESFRSQLYAKEGGYQVDEFNELREIFNAIEGRDE
ncbi:hypothetical protein PPYR_14312 [Photinus pyralis]|uniref:Uncharacterized protein n=1 Tax=Photinus pyralis TaxID=7054 RepID=A0A5N4A4V4_PHOPY|nr:uncharacterized protein LOC116180876 [Photinus pyralis]KAB0792353.1 hypothetical protein PPYR_14312 [Photinus pyralis]